MYRINNRELQRRSEDYANSLQQEGYLFADINCYEAYRQAWRDAEKYHHITDFDDANKEDGRKMCTRCRRLRHVGNFYPEPRYADRLDCYCKDCRKELHMFYQERKAERDAKVLRP